MAYFPRYAGVVAVGAAFLVSACSSTVSVPGEGGAGASGGNHNTGGTSTVGTNTGGTSTVGTSTGGSPPIDCVSAENLDPCSSPGSYCYYYDASTGETCEAFCDESFHWQKSCYVEPTYCYNPANLCPPVMPSNGGACQTTSECQYYDCEYYGTCGGSGYGMASCQGGVWYTYDDCYCFQPPTLCPMAPPQNGTSCTATQQCQTYDCEWYSYCGNNTYDYAFCDGVLWNSSGDCL